MTLQQIRTALNLHYREDPWRIFKQFRNGAVAFAAGLMIIFYAQSAFAPSAQQELTVLCGLILGGLGFIIAMLAQVRLLIGRLLRFFDRP